MKKAIFCFVLLIVSEVFAAEFEFSSPEADTAYMRGRANPEKLADLVSFPAVLAIPRLAVFLGLDNREAQPYRGVKNEWAEHARQARELIPQVPGWLEYYQWRLAELYKNANPPPGIPQDQFFKPLDRDVINRVSDARSAMHTEMNRISELNRPESFSLIGPYLLDKGNDFLDDDVGVDSVCSHATRAIERMLRRQGVRDSDMELRNWWKWWAENKGRYPQLPTEIKAPAMPPPKPVTPAATPRARPTDADRVMQAMQQTRDAMEKFGVRSVTPVPTPVPAPPPVRSPAAIPEMASKEEGGIGRWAVAGLAVGLSIVVGWLVFRRKAGRASRGSRK